MENRITQKAQELFFRYGLKSVTMDDIAAALGISKKTIYQYYDNKDSLVDAVVQHQINLSSNECQVHNEQCENAVHGMFLAMDMMQDMLSAVNPSLFFDMQKYHPEAFKKFSRHKNEFLYAVIRENIERGQKEGLYREDVNADILAKFRIESVFLALNTDLFAPEKYSLLQVELAIMENFLYGIATTKAHRQILKYKKQRQNTNL